MNITKIAQEYVRRNMTLEDALPTKMPVYVNSMGYLFGVIALCGVAMLFVSGLTMAFFGPTWYHFSRIGHFINSIHFWSVQVFFIGLVAHLITKFFIAAWRDGRYPTWFWGIMCFAVAVFTGLSGYVIQTDYDSQWIAVQAKDAFNALGIGAFINLMDTGQMLTMHVVFLPIVLILFILIHLFFVRRDSPVKPIQKKGVEK
ncbi:MAG TPA: cytochrome B6 [Porphyromonadaceae bacterium]|nr:cytochrome B6 [Porphyromonadaceae bacterium]